MLRVIRPAALCALVFAGPWFVAPAARAQSSEQPDPSVLLLMDSSKSMSKDAGGGTTRIDAAKAAVDKVVGGLPDDAEVGLRVYGGKVSGTTRRAGCRDTELTAPVVAGGAADVIRGVKGLEPTGFTPIGRSLREAPGDFPADAERKTLILISDGGDNCAPPPPCKEAEAVAKKGVELTIQVIGLQVSQGARRQLRCIAAAGGGTYVDAGDPEALSDELAAAFARARRIYLPTGKPVEGSADPSSAPVVDPGQYLDTLEPGAMKWYGVKVSRGQRMFVSIAPVPPAGARGSAGFALSLLNPMNERADSSSTLFRTDQTNNGNVDASALRGEYVGVGEFRFEEPGVYRVGAALKQGQLESDPVPIEVFIQVLEPGQAPSRTLVPTGTGDPSAPPPAATKPSSRPAATVAAESSTGLTVAVAVGVVTLVLGLLVGVLLRRRVRP